MSNAVAVVRPSDVVADDWSQERIEFIRKTYCGNAPDATAATFIEIARRRRLSPEERQIYLVPRKSQGQQTWVIQTGIDGYRVIAERTRCYAGSDEPVFEDSGKRLDNGNGKPYPTKATVTVWKIVQGQRCPFSASARWDEYNAGWNLWLSHPYTMLAKCAESGALRKAFPADLAGIYTDDEMEQAGPRDESMVAAQPATIRPTIEVVDMETGEILPDVVAYDNIPQPATTTPAKAPTKERPGGMTGAQNRKVWATAREKGLDSDDVHALATDAYDIEASLWELKRADAARLIDYLEETDVETLRHDAAEARVVVAGGADIGPEEARFIAYRDRIDAADVPTLNKIAVELAGNGQATDEIRACYRKRQEEIAKAAAAIEELPGMPVVDDTARRVRALTHP